MKRRSLYLLESAVIVSFLMSPGVRVPAAGWAEAPAGPFVSCADVESMPPSECEALVSIYNSTNGGSWYDNTNWMQNDNPCSWYGVHCESGHIYILNLCHNNLTGSMPSDVWKLGPGIIQFHLCENRLAGDIPSTLGSLTSLQDIVFFDNQFTGSIPSSLGNLTNLQGLSLNVNQLSGSIPSSLGNLSNLEWLFLGMNQLSGEIPSSLGNLANLHTLRLNINQLSGEIAPELGNMTALEELHLEHNQLTGSIPPSLGNLENLTTLALTDNQLTGTIPPQLGGLGTLRLLYLNSNAGLHGPLPDSFLDLHLDELVFNGTELCVPPGDDFETWMAQIPYTSGTGLTCCIAPFFYQRDARWYDHHLGLPGQCLPGCATERILYSHIGRCGCALTSVTMAFNAYGAELYPPQLSDSLGSWACPLHWREAANLSQNKVTWVDRVTLSGQELWQRLDQELNQNRRAVILGLCKNDDPQKKHWVFVLGGQGDDPQKYTIHDPGIRCGANLNLGDRLTGRHPCALAIYEGQTVCAILADDQEPCIERGANPDPVPNGGALSNEASGSQLVVPEIDQPFPSSVISGTVWVYRNTELTMTIEITAHSSVGSVDEMLIWSDSLTNTNWQTFNPFVWLPVSEVIYGRFRDNLGNATGVYSDTLFPVAPPDLWEAVFLPLILKDWRTIPQ